LCLSACLTSATLTTLLALFQAYQPLASSRPGYFPPQGLCLRCASVSFHGHSSSSSRSMLIYIYIYIYIKPSLALPRDFSWRFLPMSLFLFPAQLLWKSVSISLIWLFVYSVAYYFAILLPFKHERHESRRLCKAPPCTSGPGIKPDTLPSQ
jgi:hypothetical protein